MLPDGIPVRPPSQPGDVVAIAVVHPAGLQIQELTLEAELPVEVGSGADTEVRSHHRAHPEGAVTVAFLDGSLLVEDGDAVEVVHGGVEPLGERAAAPGVAVPQDELVPVAGAGAPDVLRDDLGRFG